MHLTIYITRVPKSQLINEMLPDKRQTSCWDWPRSCPIDEPSFPVATRRPHPEKGYELSKLEAAILPVFRAAAAPRGATLVAKKFYVSTVGADYVLSHIDTTVIDNNNFAIRDILRG